MKYIVVSAVEAKKDNPSVIRYPFIFPNMLVHAHIGQLLCFLVRFLHPAYEVSCTSAGEISSISIEGECHGESTTLGIESDPEDTNLIRMNDYGSSVMGI